MWVSQQFIVLGECENGAGCEWGIVLAWRDAAEHRHTWIVRAIWCMANRTSLPHVWSPKDCAAISSRRHRRIFGVAWHRPAPIADYRRHLRRLAWHELRPAGWYCVRRRRPDPATRDGPRRSVLRQPRKRAGLAGSGGAIRSRQLAHRILPGGRVCRTAVRVHQRTERWIASVGPSRIGKTTAAVCAASVIGKGGRGGAIHQWRHTGNELEAVVAGNSDNLLVLDEIGQADAKEAGNIVYMLANRSGKLRMTKNITARPTSSWCIMFLSRAK